MRIVALRGVSAAGGITSPAMIYSFLSAIDEIYEYKQWYTVM
jgi:Na+/H+ antiporter NhaA